MTATEASGGDQDGLGEGLDGQGSILGARGDQDGLGDGLRNL